MDIDQILSLLRASNNQTSTDANTNTAPQSTSAGTNSTGGDVSTTTFAAGLPTIDLSSISADVIREVQQEYWSQQQPKQKEEEDPNSLDKLLDSISLKELKSINSEVLVALGRMVKETNLMQVLRECRKLQDEKEQSLFEQRQNLIKKFEKRKDGLFAEEMIGNKVDWKALEKEQEDELRLFDSHVLRETDKLVRSQQEELEKGEQ